MKDTVLLKELIDLGLPKENCESIVKAFQDNLERLKEKKLNSILKGKNFCFIVLRSDWISWWSGRL